MELPIQHLEGGCLCGQAHTLSTKEILLERGALTLLPQVISRYGYKAPLVVCDGNTYLAAAGAVTRLLDCEAVVLPERGLHADEHAVERLNACLPQNLDMLLAVGAGTIHDIVRYTAYERQIPFISVPTAASVDGFVSAVATMTWKGVKKSFSSAAPLAVIADTDVLIHAPYRLTASGVSDLMGKYTAIADWRIAHLVTGEFFCERIANMALEAVEAAAGALDGLQNEDTEAYERLMYGLLLSGLAMQMVGNSRPASGAEHHLSHLWEMEAINAHLDALHGEKVSVGLMLLLPHYQAVGRAIREGRCQVRPYKGLERELLEAAFKEPEKLQGILLENASEPLETIDLQKLEAQLCAIAEIIEALPAEEKLRELLRLGGCRHALSDIGLAPPMEKLSLQLSPYVRNRLTLLRMLKMLSIQE